MTMQNMFALSLGLAGVLLAAQAAQAQPAGAQCGPRAAVLGALTQSFGETRRGMGLAGTQGAAVVELFASDGGTWTVTVTLPDGRTCLIASGQGWEAVTEQLPARGAPA